VQHDRRRTRKYGKKIGSHQKEGVNYVRGIITADAYDPDPADRLDHIGPGKLPELGAGFGKSIKEFKKALREGQDATAIEHKDEKKV
jgi:hypothetical protein